MVERLLVTSEESQQVVGKTAVLRNGDRRRITSVTKVLWEHQHPSGRFVVVDFARPTRGGNTYGFLYLTGYDEPKTNWEQKGCPSDVMALENAK